MARKILIVLAASVVSLALALLLILVVELPMGLGLVLGMTPLMIAGVAVSQGGQTPRAKD